MKGEMKLVLLLLVAFVSISIALPNLGKAKTKAEQKIKECPKFKKDCPYANKFDKQKVQGCPKFKNGCPYVTGDASVAECPYFPGSASPSAPIANCPAFSDGSCPFATKDNHLSCCPSFKQGKYEIQHNHHTPNYKELIFKSSVALLGNKPNFSILKNMASDHLVNVLNGKTFDLPLDKIEQLYKNTKFANVDIHSLTQQGNTVHLFATWTLQNKKTNELLTIVIARLFHFDSSGKAWKVETVADSVALNTLASWNK